MNEVNCKCGEIATHRHVVELPTMGYNKPGGTVSTPICLRCKVTDMAIGALVALKDKQAPTHWGHFPNVLDRAHADVVIAKKDGPIPVKTIVKTTRYAIYELFRGELISTGRIPNTPTVYLDTNLIVHVLAHKS